MTSTIKVNNIQNQCGANINESSNTITMRKWRYHCFSIRYLNQGSVELERLIGRQQQDNFITAVNGEGYFVILHQV